MKAVRDITDGSSRTVCTRGIWTEVVKGEDVSAGGAWSRWMCDSIREEEKEREEREENLGERASNAWQQYSPWHHHRLVSHWEKNIGQLSYPQ